MKTCFFSSKTGRLLSYIQGPTFWLHVYILPMSPSLAPVYPLQTDIFFLNRLAWREIAEYVLQDLCFVSREHHACAQEAIAEFKERELKRLSGVSPKYTKSVTIKTVCIVLWQSRNLLQTSRVFFLGLLCRTQPDAVLLERFSFFTAGLFR